MTNCDGFGIAPRREFRVRAVRYRVNSGSADLRWALAALALQSLVVLGANCRLSSSWPEGMDRGVSRLARGRFADDVAPADTTVAAGRG